MPWGYVFRRFGLTSSNPLQNVREVVRLKPLALLAGPIQGWGGKGCTEVGSTAQSVDCDSRAPIQTRWNNKCIEKEVQCTPAHVLSLDPQHSPISPPSRLPSLEREPGLV